MPSLVASGTDTYTYLDAYQQNRAEEPESILPWAELYLRIRNKQPLHQDLDISEERSTLLLTQVARYAIRALYSKDLPKALENVEAVSKYWKAFHTFVFTEEEKSVSTVKDALDIEIETPERRQITWEQAHVLAFTSLIDAEERRRHFAEEEAKLTAIWEELD